MPPRTKSAPNTRVAALIPVNSEGDQVGEAQNWGMPVDQIEHEESSIAVIPREEPVEQSATDRVLAMLQDAGSDASAKVQIYRIMIAPTGAKKKLVFVDEMPPEDFERGSLKMLATAYGGGEYEIRLYGATGDGSFGLRSRVQVSVEAPPRNFDPMPARNDVSAILQAMQESNAQLMRAMTERPVADPMAQMTQMFTMMKLMREATGDTGNNLGDTLKQIAALKEAGNLFEKPEKEEGLMGMLETMAPLLMAGMQKNPQALPVTVPPAIAAPAVTYQKPGEDDFTAIMELPMLTIGQKIKLRGTLATLLEMARQNVDANEGAELVLDSLPDEMIEVLDSDQWWEVFSEIVPSAIPLQAWFTVVRDLAVNQLEDDDAELSTDSGAQSAPVAGPGNSGAVDASIAPAPAATLKRATRAKAAGPAAAPGEPAPKP